MAQRVTFDATRVNNLPALEADTAHAAPPPDRPMQRRRASPADAPTPVAPPRTFSIPGGSVQADTAEAGMVGLTVNVPDSFWSGYEGSTTYSACSVVGVCVRDFLHPDGAREATHVIQWEDQFFPIKTAALARCLTRDQRLSLQRHARP